MKLNLKLLQALLDYFKVESKTFKIRWFDYMITLEDVLFITGLPIDGNPVTGKKCKAKRYMYI